MAVKPTGSPATPYADLPSTAFWRSAVAEPGIWGMKGLWRSKWQLPSDARFATFGSCFAQHISRALQARGVPWLNAEPAPGRSPAALAESYNYGVYSARTGNIYTAAQLLALVEMAAGRVDADAAEIWPDGPGWRDSLRPLIEPAPFATRQEALLSRIGMIRAFRRSITDADVFVFTLGLTEGWEHAGTGQPYPMCPGTAAGSFDAGLHRFVNYDYPRIRSDLETAFGLMRGLNPGLRLLLTVSPVPLTATATGDHVLAATTYSKSTLRAVAGDLASADPAIDYFPSYEIIAGAPARGAFWEPNLRSVSRAGVDLVMAHVFAGLDLGGPAVHGPEVDRAVEIEARMDAAELVCEEMTLERFNAR